MKEKLEQLIIDALTTLSLPVTKVEVNYPKELGHGDYMTNVAMVTMRSFAEAVDSTTGEITLARFDLKLPKTPKELAEIIAGKILETKPNYIEKVEVAGPGFINFYLSDSYFKKVVTTVLEKGDAFGNGDTLSGKKIVLEYTQPNPFKPFHIGHLMSNAIGESLSRIFESQGASVIRANYQGDIGPHVAKAMYGIMKKDSGILGATPSEKANYIGECYAFGSDLYETDETAKKEINELNQKLYAYDPVYKALYDEGREVTLEAFEEIYKMLGTKFDVYFFESEMVDSGVALVKKYTDVFEASEGAMVFKAEKYNPKLHTRVFITKYGLPTYEAKELALTQKKFETYNPDISVVTTAVEQKDYVAVVTEAIRQMFPNEQYTERMEHIAHGMMRFATGKMSSRKGNVITGESLIRDAKSAIYEKMADRVYEHKEAIAEAVGVAAIKYSILRSSTGSDIIYDFETSISFEGDSGPYVQYTATRANAVLQKADEAHINPSLSDKVPTGLIERLLERFPVIVRRASDEREPHHLVTYITELAGAFNSFYGNETIVSQDKEVSSDRVALTKAVLLVLARGLHLLGIRLPEKM